MKDAKGHGSNKRGIHAAGVEKVTERGTLHGLMADAKTRGVSLSMDHLDPGDWQLSWIDRLGAPKGSGAKVMQQIGEAADRHGAKVTLQAHEGAKKLVKYYGGFGYKKAGYGDENGPVMVRKPK